MRQVESLSFYEATENRYKTNHHKRYVCNLLRPLWLTVYFEYWRVVEQTDEEEERWAMRAEHHVHGPSETEWRWARSTDQEAGFH